MVIKRVKISKSKVYLDSGISSRRAGLRLRTLYRQYGAHVRPRYEYCNYV